jgi:hypothetical protein
MVAVNPAGPTGFGGIQGPSNPDGTVFVDTVDGVPAAGPAIVPSAAIPPPTFATAMVTPTSIVDTAGVPPQNAMLIELRVIANLLLMMIGSPPGATPDLTQMRADEFWNTSIGNSSGIN